jgi:hypothetical protein
MLTARQAKDIVRNIDSPSELPDISIQIENKIKEALDIIQLAAGQGETSTTINTWNNSKNLFIGSGLYAHVTNVLHRLGYQIEWDTNGSTEYVIISWG